MTNPLPVRIWLDLPNASGIRIYYWKLEGSEDEPSWPGRISLKGALEAARKEFGDNIKIVLDDSACPTRW